MFRLGLQFVGGFIVLGLLMSAPAIISLHRQYDRVDAATALADLNLGTPRQFADLPAGHYRVADRLDGMTMVVASLTPHGDVYYLVGSVPASLGKNGTLFTKYTSA